jgi:hypothetical protein
VPVFKAMRVVPPISWAFRRADGKSTQPGPAASSTLISEAEFEEQAAQPGTVEHVARDEGRVLYAA